MFLFRTNPNLANLTLRGIYVLNAEGTRFDLQEADYVLKPFEAYITANSGEAAALTVVRSDGRTVYAASIAPGDTRLALPSGIYMIRINNITYKIAL